MYNPAPIPSNLPRNVQRYLREELRRISVQFTRLNNLGLESLAAEPDKYSDGQVVYADGTNWNPGSGEGLYARYNSAWNALAGGGGGGVDSMPGVFRNSDTQTLGTATTETLELDTESLDDSNNYSVDVNNEITVATAGVYFVAANVPLDDGGTSGATRSEVTVLMQQDGGTGTWVEPPGTIRGRCYARETSTGQGVNCSGIMTLLEDEKIRVSLYKGTSTNVDTDHSLCSLHIYRIE